MAHSLVSIWGLLHQQLPEGFLCQGDSFSISIVLFHSFLTNVNLMVAQVAKTVFGVSRVIARVFDPSRQAVYDQFGIDTVCPTLLSANVFLAALRQGPGETAS